MTADRTASPIKWVGLATAGLSLFLALVGILFFIIYSPGLNSSVVVLNAVVYSLIAALIFARQPKHIIAWLFLLIGLFSALLMLASSMEEIVTYDSSNVLHNLLAWTTVVLFLPPLMIALTLTLQFFPDGHLPSRRWWPIPAVTIFGILSFSAVVAFTPGPLGGSNPLGPDNPFALPGSEQFLTTLSDIAGIAFAVGVMGAILILIVRFRRAGTIERTQMKWLFYTAVVGLSALLLSGPVLSLLGLPSETLSEILFLIMPSLLAITIGIAILRYRLFDIDVIIRRTLQYGIVTVILALVYFGLVIIFQGMFAAVGDQQSGFFIVLSTLVIAALFNPVRKRVQKAVDRRFYRQKYQADQILADFAAVTRDEVDLDQIAAALMEVVEETMQPERASLSLLNRESE